MEHLEFDMARYVVRLRAPGTSRGLPRTSPALGRRPRLRAVPSHESGRASAFPIVEVDQALVLPSSWPRRARHGRPQANSVASHIELQMFYGAGLARTVAARKARVLGSLPEAARPTYDPPRRSNC